MTDLADRATRPAPPLAPVRRSGGLLVLVVLLIIGALVASAVVLRTGPLAPLLAPERCVATADGRTVSVTPEQAMHAATIAAIATERGLPARATTIALATAYQESDLENLSGGDRDSAGLFQQRPSQGWGAYDQVTDPIYAANAFYDALVKLDGYRSMEITVAAQAVQRSAFPNAYSDHEDDARILASALSGNSAAAFTCNTRASAVTAQTPNDRGLTPRADTVRRDVAKRFGPQSLGGFAPGGVTSGHSAGSAHYDGRAIDIFFRPYDDPANNRAGWALAHWLVANAGRLEVATVIYDDRIWTAARSGEGWRDYELNSTSRDEGTAAIQRHLDHVHVDVLPGS